MALTLDEVVFMTKLYCRNFFNKKNSMSAPPDNTLYYQLFLSLCSEIHDAMNSPEWKVRPYTSETVLGLHSWSKGQRGDGTPIDLLDVYGNRLREFILHTYTS